MSERKVQLKRIKHQRASFFMISNWISSLAMLNNPMDTSKMAILAMMATIVMAILAMSIGLFNMAKLDIQLESMKKLARWCLILFNWTLRSDSFYMFVILSFACKFYNVKKPIIWGQLWEMGKSYDQIFG